MGLLHLVTGARYELRRRGSKLGTGRTSRLRLAMQSRSLPRLGSLLPEVFTNSPQQSWEDWKEDFQAAAAVNVWTDDEKRHVLTLRLRGPAREALRDISEDKKSTFSTLLAALNERFVPPNQAELKRTELRLRRQGPQETVQDFGNVIRSLAIKAYPEMEAKHRDILARDQFLDGLNNGHLRLRTRYGKPSSLKDAVRTALEVQAAEAFEARRSSPPKAEAVQSVNSAVGQQCDYRRRIRYSHLAAADGDANVGSAAAITKQRTEEQAKDVRDDTVRF